MPPILRIGGHWYDATDTIPDGEIEAFDGWLGFDPEIADRESLATIAGYIVADPERVARMLATTDTEDVADDCRFAARLSDVV